MHVRMLWFCRYLSEMVMSVFTVRRYVSAVLAMALCLSVCLCVRHKSDVLSERIELIFGIGALFDRSYFVT